MFSFFCLLQIIDHFSDWEYNWFLINKYEILLFKSLFNVRIYSKKIKINYIFNYINDIFFFKICMKIEADIYLWGTNCAFSKKVLCFAHLVVCLVSKSKGGWMGATVEVLAKILQQLLNYKIKTLLTYLNNCLFSFLFL